MPPYNPPSSTGTNLQTRQPTNGGPIWRLYLLSFTLVGLPVLMVITAVVDLAIHYVPAVSDPWYHAIVVSLYSLLGVALVVGAFALYACFRERRPAE